MNMKIASVFLVLLVEARLTFSENYEDFDILEEDKGHPLSKGVNKFAFSIYKLLADKQGSIFFSPFSISTCTMMLYLMTNKETAAEIEEALQMSPGSGELYHQLLKEVTYNDTVKLANKAFLHEKFPVKESYLQTIKEHLEAESENVNFNGADKARKIINSWTSDKTKGKVPELLPIGSVSGDTRMVLVSTIYFKGNWHYEFNPRQTKEREFHTEKGDVKSIPMMKLTRRLGYQEYNNLDARVLQMPYKDSRQNFVIILPNKKDGLRGLERNLTEVDFQQMLWESSDYIKVKAIIPKFRLEESQELREVIPQVGITRVFRAELADFTNATDVIGLEVSSVRHSACFEIDEVGTEAAAATGIVLTMRSGFAYESTPDFVADHPFIFAITDTTTKSVLFVGRFAGPSI